MKIISQLEANKGTVSSALGKALAKKVLEGDLDILNEAIELCTFDLINEKTKHIRAGAAKIVELVAEKKPELMAPFLEKLLPALTVKEPQTRWMIIRTMGFCAPLNKKTAKKAISFARQYIKENEGLCIVSSADLFLGDFGAISSKDAELVFPYLEESSQNVILNEQDWLMESFIKIFKLVNDDCRGKITKFAKQWTSHSRKSTQARANKLLKLTEEHG
ncbi:MAG: hypothetical protein C4562_05005 [Actinobacteria bacterium]|nr:MAG: hypothetical protein C4562_05005 [Actinomycetota bacterium]